MTGAPQTPTALDAGRSSPDAWVCKYRELAYAAAGLQEISNSKLGRKSL
jgi:hypothetical protein